MTNVHFGPASGLSAQARFNMSALPRLPFLMLVALDYTCLPGRNICPENRMHPFFRLAGVGRRLGLASLVVCLRGKVGLPGQTLAGGCWPIWRW